MPSLKETKTVFPYNPSVDLGPEASSDWPAEIRSHTERQNWTFHPGNAKLMPKDGFFCAPRAAETVGRRDEEELEPFSRRLTGGMLPGLHVNTCASSVRGQTGLSPGADVSLPCNHKQTVAPTGLASGGLPQLETSFRSLQVWTQLPLSTHTWDGHIYLLHMSDYTSHLLAFKLMHNPTSMRQIPARLGRKNLLEICLDHLFAPTSHATCRHVH